MENDSILNSVKAMLISYMDPDDDAFDTDLLIHINTVLSILFQLGVGNQEFHITGPDETWEDFLGTTKTGMKQSSITSHLIAEGNSNSGGTTAYCQVICPSGTEGSW